MEVNLNFLKNGSQPQFFQKWKTRSIFKKIEDDLNFWKSEAELKNLENGRQS
jgi:hypothetical protein